MAAATDRTALQTALTSINFSSDVVRQRTERIHQRMLSLSPFLRKANFTRISTDDLKMMFETYDQLFFDGLLQNNLNGSPLHFRLSPRLTASGGVTKRFRLPSGQVRYEIAVASTLLFDAFREGDRPISVGGLECTDRLQALQRIFEHELVHLTEMLCWTASNCSEARFQRIASGYFLHRAHTHSLVTRYERAANAGICVGTLVQFSFEGRRLTGRVNRITKRATILVEDPAGLPYSDGKRYSIFYVPLRQLVAAGPGLTKTAPNANTQLGV